ncbi:hypothetical protein Bealeia1_00612 [Candidatus Bealeia paramacronuclearis]|uniref:Uncharacterized protein n=1 Tax=Candidatus Bealeia paramacronuclearis TaxID=1921001 RepID=A0ABZ2C667_9PROT|nr:hypothetical protein [Candidatus Bealeia paramacronuclearis]
MSLVTIGNTVIDTVSVSTSIIQNLIGTLGNKFIIVYSPYGDTFFVDESGGGNIVEGLGAANLTVVFHATDVAYFGFSSGLNTLDVSDVAIGTAAASQNTIDLRGSVAHSGPLVFGFDVLDLTNNGMNTKAHTVLLDAQGVDNFSDGCVNSITHMANSMVIKAGQNDIINMGSLAGGMMSTGGWTQAADKTFGGIVYHDYVQTFLEGCTNETVNLFIQNRAPIAVVNTTTPTFNEHDSSMNVNMSNVLTITDADLGDHPVITGIVYNSYTRVTQFAAKGWESKRKT